MCVCVSLISAYLLLVKEECSRSGHVELSEIKNQVSQYVHRPISDWHNRRSYNWHGEKVDNFSHASLEVEWLRLARPFFITAKT